MNLRGGPRRPLAIGLAILVIGTFGVASAIELATARTNFDRWIDDEAKLVIEVVSEALDGVTADLESVAAFVHLADPDADHFEQFVDRIDGTANAVGIGYLTELDASAFDEYTAKQRDLYGSEYEIFGIDETAEPAPIERSGRTTFYPVRHFALGNPIRAAMAADPEIGNIGPGLDAGFDPIWRVDIARALDIDGPTFSGFTSLNMDFVVLDRVFFASVPVAGSPGTSRGLVVAMMVEELLLPDLQREVLGNVEWEAIPPGTEFVIPDNQNTRVYPLELPGTTWSLAIAPTDDALANLEGLPWWVSGTISATLAFFAALALWLYVDRRGEHKRVRRFQQLARDKDRFLASISHELRTPLTVVSGLVYELHDQPGGFSKEEHAELTEILVEQTDELCGIVEDLLIAARSDIARVAIHLGDADLGALAAQTLETSAVEATMRGIPGHAHADPQRVRQILRNLLTNAERYGGPQVRIDFADGSGWTEISVADNGKGVPIEKRGSIFNSYESAHAPGTNVGSVGLGLYISRNLARAMGGDLEYFYDGTWSHFRLRLPRAPASSKSAAEAVTPDAVASV